MNHAEHDESIGSMLASIAAALREVSDKLDIVAARVQQEVPPFPADEDIPDQTRIRRLESWAFHASQDISRLSSRLDALDGGETEQAPPRAGRGTRSRREVREAAEAAERAAADLDEGAAEPDRAVRPPLERRSSRTDHLGDPTWPITVAPVPRPSAAFEPAGEVAGVAALLGSEGAPRSPFTAPEAEARPSRVAVQAEGSAGGSTVPPTGRVSTASAVDTASRGVAVSDDSAEARTQNGTPVTVNGAQPIDRAQRLNGARSADAAVNGARAADRPALNGAASNGAQVPNGAAPLRNTQATNGAGTVDGVTAIDGAEPLETRPLNPAVTQVGDAVPTPARDAVPAQDGGTQSVVAGAEYAPASTAAGGTSNSMSGNGIGVAESDPAAGGRGSDDAEITVPGSVAAQSGAGSGRQGAARADDSVIQALEWQVTQRLSSNGSGQGGWSGAGRNADSGARAGSNSVLGRDGASAGTQSDDLATLGSSSLTGSAEVGDVVRGGDVTLSGITGDQANTAAMNAMPEGRADIGQRPGVERARPVGRPAEGAAAPVGDAGAPEALSGTGIDTTAGETSRAVSDPRSSGLTAGGRTGPATNGYSANGFGAPVTATPTTTSGSTANGIHWTFTDEDATLPPPSRNGHARNGFTGGDSPHRTESIFDDFTPRERLTTTPSGDEAPTPAGPPARLSAPKSHADTGANGFDAAPLGPDPALPHGNSPDLGTPAGGNASTDGRDEHTHHRATEFGTPQNLGASTNGRGELTHSAPADFGGSANPNGFANGRGPASFDPALDHGTQSDFGAPASAGDGAPVTSPLDRVVADPAPPTATDAAGLTVTGTFRAFDIERAHVDKLQAMLDELKRSAGLPPGRRDVFGPPTTEPG
ncbi:hypothetical protein ACFU44_28435 [Nocardia rhizosphaerihabitans]|uniref:hypothetical protein n=1 Tax=Nocardia rhizosphaerihabitans TaxID=1691570 RepID=UPI00366B6B0A